MAALFLHPSAGQHDDVVGSAHGREAVRDKDRRETSRNLEEPIEQLDLGAHVEVGGRFVEHQHVGARLDGEERARQRDPLPLPAGELDAAREAAREDGVHAAGQGVDEIERPGPLGRAARQGLALI